MAEDSLTQDRRAQMVALFGLITQVVVVGVVVGIWYWSQSAAIGLSSWFFAGAIPIWIVTLLIYTQRKRSRIESLETEELKRRKETAERIFEIDDEALLLERRRLQTMMKWSIPAVGILLVIYHLLVAWIWYRHHPTPWREEDWAYTRHPSIVIWFVGGVCFACFLLSRYASGMARHREWRLLRSAAAYLTGNALAGLALVVALALSIYDVALGEPIAAIFTAAVMAILAVEFLINIILDFYRPRVPGEQARPGFDSRLLGLLTEPGGIARSIAEAVNYQFGFEVSRTWFYQLMQRSVLWLVLFMVVILWGLSSVLIVDADEVAVVERFGRQATTLEEVYQPGLHFKWPWPFEKAYRAPVLRVTTMNVGEGTDSKHDGEDPHDEEKAILWADTHGVSPEELLLVAGPRDLAVATRATTSTGEAAQSVSIALVHASVAIQYRIGTSDKVLDYLYRYQNPDTVVRSLALRVLSRFAAGTELAALMGPGRERFNETIADALQKEVDDLGLGFEITFTAIQDAHPPADNDVAKTYLEVVSAERRKGAAIEAARGQAQEIKTQTAGSVGVADALDAAILEMDRLSADPTADPDALAEAKANVDAFFEFLSSAEGVGLAGDAARAIADAHAEVIDEVSRVASKARIADVEVATYLAAPELFLMRRWLETYTDNVKSIRKFVVATPGNIVITIEQEDDDEFIIAEEDESTRATMPAVR